MTRRIVRDGQWRVLLVEGDRQVDSFSLPAYFNTEDKQRLQPVIDAIMAAAEKTWLGEAKG